MNKEIIRLYKSEISEITTIQYPETLDSAVILSTGETLYDVLPSLRARVNELLSEIPINVIYITNAHSSIIISNSFEGLENTVRIKNMLRDHNILNFAEDPFADTKSMTITLIGSSIEEDDVENRDLVTLSWIDHENMKVVILKLLLSSKSVYEHAFVSRNEFVLSDFVTSSNGNFTGNITVNGVNVVLTNDSRLINSRPASDVYAWAKSPTKPVYTWDEISGRPEVDISVETGSDWNSIANDVSTGFFSGSANGPVLNYTVTGISLPMSSSVGYNFQLASRGKSMWFRTKEAGVLGSWNKIWHSGEMGSKSGLDADMIDGVHNGDLTSSYIRMIEQEGNSVDANSIIAGMFTTYNSGFTWINGPDGMGYGGIFNINNGRVNPLGVVDLSPQFAYDVNHNSSKATKNLWFRASNNLGFQNDWVKIWHSGISGSGSGMDADMLDGLHASDFVASNNDSLVESLRFKLAIDNAERNYYVITTATQGTGGNATQTTIKTGFNKNFGTTSDSVCRGNDSRLSNSRPASDVYAWAKASTKPKYTASEIEDLESYILDIPTHAETLDNFLYDPAYTTSLDISENGIVTGNTGIPLALFEEGSAFMSFGTGYKKIQFIGSDGDLFFRSGSDDRQGTFVKVWDSVSLTTDNFKPKYAGLADNTLKIGDVEYWEVEKIIDEFYKAFKISYNSDGTVENIQALAGLWSEDYISSGGIGESSGGGTGGLDESAMWIALGGSMSNKIISVDHIPTIPYSKISGTPNLSIYVENDDYRLSNARPASDVYAWAKGTVKPTYQASEIVGIESVLVNEALTSRESKELRGSDYGINSLTFFISDTSISGSAAAEAGYIVSNFGWNFSGASGAMIRLPYDNINPQYKSREGGWKSFVFSSDKIARAELADNTLAVGSLSADEVVKAVTDFTKAFRITYQDNGLLDHVEVLAGLWSNTYLSAGGIGPDGGGGGGGGLDLNAMWIALGGSINNQIISIDHIPTIPYSKISNAPDFIEDGGSVNSLNFYLTSNTPNQYYVITSARQSDGGALTQTTINTAFNKNFGAVSNTVCEGDDSRLSNSRPASDVYAWAKASVKPTYTWNEITNRPSEFKSTTLSIKSSERTPTPANSDIFEGIGVYFSGLTESTYSDFIILNTYKNYTGGRINAMEFRKNSREVYLHQGDWDVDSWDVPYRIWHENNLTTSNFKPLYAGLSDNTKAVGSMTSDYVNDFINDFNEAFTLSRASDGSITDIKANFGLWSVDYISSGGVGSSSGGSGGLDESAMWIALGGTMSNKVISEEHIPTVSFSKIYDTPDFLKSIGSTTTDLRFKVGINTANQQYVLTTASQGNGGAVSQTTISTAFNKNFGTAAGTVCQGNDSRLSNSRPASDVYTRTLIANGNEYQIATKYSPTASEIQLDSIYYPLYGGKLTGPAIIPQQNPTAHGTGLRWQTLDDTAIIAGIGCLTIGDAVSALYMGWGTDPYMTDSSFKVNSTNMLYKGLVVYHAGNFTPSNYLPLAGGTMTGNLTVSAEIYTSGWFRSTGAKGWINHTYGGGIYMTDNSWVKVYGSKKFQVLNTTNDSIATSGGIKFGTNFYLRQYTHTGSSNRIGLLTNTSAAGLNAGNLYIGSSFADSEFNKVPANGLYVSGSSVFNSSLTPYITNIVSLGSSISRWNNVFSLNANLSGSLTAASISISGLAGIAQIKLTGSTPQIYSETSTLNLGLSGSSRMSILTDRVNPVGVMSLGSSAVRWNALYIGSIDASGRIASADRRSCLAGSHNAALIQGIWSIGLQYGCDIDGADYGNMFGLAYKYGIPSSTVAMNRNNGHQMVWCINGVAKTSIGEGVLTDGDIIAGGYISAVGSVNAGGIATSSDIRLKDNIRPLESSLDYILNTEYVWHTWKSNGTPDIGIIAQSEIDRDFNYLVKTNDRGEYAYDYQKHSVLIGKALQELHLNWTEREDIQDREIEELKSEIKSLKEKIEKWEE